MKYDIQFTNQFKKDLKLAKKQNKKSNRSCFFILWLTASHYMAETVGFEPTVPRGTTDFESASL